MSVECCLCQKRTDNIKKHLKRKHNVSKKKIHLLIKKRKTQNYKSDSDESYHSSSDELEDINSEDENTETFHYGDTFQKRETNGHTDITMGENFGKKERGIRKETQHSIRENNLDAVVDPRHMNSFRKFLQNPFQGNKSATSAEYVTTVSRYLRYSTERPDGQPQWDKLTDYNHISKWLFDFYSRTTIAHTSLLKYIDAIRAALEFIESQGNSRVTRENIEMTKRKLVKCKKGLYKNASLEANRRAINLNKTLLTTSARDLGHMLRNHSMKTRYFHLCGLDYWTRNEYSFIISYLAAQILFNNGQRSGIIENFTIPEYEALRAVVTGDKVKYVADVAKHKLSSMGCAQIVFTKEVKLMLDTYQKDVRPKIAASTEDHEDLFFLNFNGNPFKKVSQGIQTIWHKMGFQGQFSVTLQRKLIDSAASRTVSSDCMRRLNKHMNHSQAVSFKTYQGRSDKDAAEDQAIIDAILNPIGDEEEGERMSDSDEVAHKISDDLNNVATVDDTCKRVHEDDSSLYCAASSSDVTTESQEADKEIYNTALCPKNTKENNYFDADTSELIMDNTNVTRKEGSFLSKIFNVFFE